MDSWLRDRRRRERVDRMQRAAVLMWRGSLVVLAAVFTAVTAPFALLFAAPAALAGWWMSRRSRRAHASRSWSANPRPVGLFDEWGRRRARKAMARRARRRARSPRS